MKIYRFYKEVDSKWYIDLPEWEGMKAELQMVEGADTMLDIISEGETETNIVISLEPFEQANILELIENLSIEQKEIIKYCDGAFYILKKYEGFEYNITLWLCNVMLYVFGGFPEKIYLKRSL
jgi:hypothetical protein